MSQTEPLSNNKEAAQQEATQTQQRFSTIISEVPKRPALAPNIQLVGEMQETGFKDRQWLIRRDGQFIQLTELLYRILEQSNGQRTLEEIAAKLTESTDWMVTADNVRQLVQTKLIPLGLIAPADGTAEPCGREDRRELRRGERARSPLAVNMRMRILGPSVIDPFTSVFQVLFAPPVLIPILAAISIAHGWLYFVHGVADSFRDALYTPGGLLVVLALTLAAAVFHEFGHASALRYGGGKVRGMGAGIYIIYPVLYTDVTDSYRLGRWARVRTGLGGIYFNLVFALGIVTFYLISGQELVLLAVTLINLEIIRQFLPFIRLDGYWVLADLTGIPDFFSQIGPFLRSVLPIPGWEGDKLPNLKPWVKTAFAIYICVTIPVLFLLLYLLVTRLPFIVATVWDSLPVHADIFSAAQSSGDLLGMAASGSQMIMLALPLVGLAYLLYRLSRLSGGLLRAIWNWSAKSKEQPL
jgi:putative peptide zinc metalloprotease protein